MDEQQHPEGGPLTFTGHAIGKYEGDTLVVDTVDMNDLNWIDRLGHPHTDALHVEERIRRVKPDWLEAAKHTAIPNLSFDSGYLVMLTGLIGTTIAPWQFFYLQAGFVEKRVGPRQYPQARADVLIGSVSCMVIVFFIIVCTAATLYVSGHRNITDAGQAAQALIPLAGKWAGMLFAFGLCLVTMNKARSDVHSNRSN